MKWSTVLGRRLRQDGVATLGTSSLSLFERAAGDGRPDVAIDLLAYAWDEMTRIGEALRIWLADILAAHARVQGGALSPDTAGSALNGLFGFDPSAGDRKRAAEAAQAGDAPAAASHAESMRIRYASLHDAYVSWIQTLLTDIANAAGEEAVFDVVAATYQHLWRPRYASWDEMPAIEQLQLSVEGMRGHLSGPRRRGDLTIVDEPDRWVMVLDPCGSCGILRRGDPESGRPPAHPAGNRTPHAWTWWRTGISWYAVHSAIALEVLPARERGAPLRPIEGCDLNAPCRWFVYKDGHAPRAEDVARTAIGKP